MLQGSWSPVTIKTTTKAKNAAKATVYNALTGLIKEDPDPNCRLSSL